MLFIICYHRLPCCSSYVTLLYHILSYLTVCVYHVLPCFITFYHVFFTMFYHVSNDMRRLPLPQMYGSHLATLGSRVQSGPATPVSGNNKAVHT